MKGKTTMTIVICLICIILTAVMFLQFKTISRIDVTALENMQETELRSEISSWKTRYEDISKELDDTKLKIAEYKEKVTSNRRASELLSNELDRLTGILGSRDVTGPGVVLTLSDNENAKIRSIDLLKLVNELKVAGAESIAINGERIVYDSYIVDIGSGYGDAFIRINGKQGQVSPYIVEAIGNPTYLESVLSKKQYGYIDTQKAEGKTISFETRDSITIKKYEGNLNLDEKYIKE